MWLISMFTGELVQETLGFFFIVYAFRAMGAILGGSQHVGEVELDHWSGVIPRLDGAI